MPLRRPRSHNDTPRAVRFGRARRRAHAELSLADEWRAWIAENLLRGATAEVLLESLVDKGVSRAIAAREIAEIASSPAVTAARAIARRLRRLELVARIRRELGRALPEEVPRRADVGAEEFFEHYYARNEPVVLTDVVTAWPALGRWSPAYFREHFGAIEVEVCDGREGDPDYDMNFEHHRARTRMADFAARVERSPASNDFYMVANNRNMERAQLAPLLAEVVLPDRYLDPARIDGCASLWFGPGGTLTPWHHDTTNILFCQVYGRKRVSLISPLETALLEEVVGVYQPRDVTDREGFARARKRVVELAPGEALFIPASYWHEVLALSPSINLSFTNFRRPNQFDWYLPGAQ